MNLGLGSEDLTDNIGSNRESRESSFNRGMSKVNYNPTRGINFSEP